MCSARCSSLGGGLDSLVTFLKDELDWSQKKAVAATGAVTFLVAHIAIFGLKAGAVASSVGHDAHNVIVAGTNEADMQLATDTLRRSQGGVCVVRDGRVIAMVELPIAGLLSDKRAGAVARETTALKQAWLEAGCTLPYMGFNLIPLSVIPEIRITDKGLVLVPAMTLVPLFEP